MPGCLVLFYLLPPPDLAAFVQYAIVPPEAQTPEFDRLCETCDGTMYGEEEDDAVDEAIERLDALCTPYMSTKHFTNAVRLDGACVDRVVTVSYGT